MSTSVPLYYCARCIHTLDAKKKLQCKSWKCCNLLFWHLVITLTLSLMSFFSGWKFHRVAIITWLNSHVSQIIYGFICTHINELVTSLSSPPPPPVWWDDEHAKILPPSVKKIVNKNCIDDTVNRATIMRVVFFLFFFFLLRRLPFNPSNKSNVFSLFLLHSLTANSTCKIENKKKSPIALEIESRHLWQLRKQQEKRKKKKKTRNAGANITFTFVVAVNWFLFKCDPPWRVATQSTVKLGQSDQSWRKRKRRHLHRSTILDEWMRHCYSKVANYLTNQSTWIF